MESQAAIEFSGSGEWRHWLQQNHNRVESAWLIHYKKSSNKAGLSYGQALDEALCFGWIDVRMRSIDKDRFMIRYTPRKKKSVWSRINRDRAESLIEAGRMTPAGLAKIEEARQNGLWDTAYTSLEKEEVPADLKAALVQDKTADVNFNSFANSYRNSYIGWINAAKTGQTRRRRIDEVVKRSRLNKKPGM